MAKPMANARTKAKASAVAKPKATAMATAMSKARTMAKAETLHFPTGHDNKNKSELQKYVLFCC